ncbi:MAG: rhomboid family intramembrane serine protease [Flavobacteriaceae bacterium]|nr:rhomboid family intramembrane serine protease [Flavobacteriaceae bacterium]
MIAMDPVLLLLIVANVLFSIKGFKDYSFFEKYKFNVGAIQRGEHIRNLSSGFLHADNMHLAFNMITLFFFAPVVIRGFSGNSYKFLCIYFVSLLLGSFLSLLIRKNEPYYSAIGASGAVTGIVYAAILLDPSLRIYGLPGFVFGIGYLVYSIYGMKNRVGNIGHTAHFGGAIGGYIATILIQPQIIETNLITVLILAAPIIALFVLEKMGKLN